MTEWTNENLDTVDPANPIFDKKEHLEQIRLREDIDPQVYDNAGNLVVDNVRDNVQIQIGKNLKIIDFDENSITHKLVEYTPIKYNGIGTTYTFTDSSFMKDEVSKDAIGPSDWQVADSIRMISEILIPTGQEQSLTTNITTFAQAKHLQEARDIITDNLRLKTRQTLDELLGTTRTEIDCPFMGCDFTILPTELYCSHAWAESLGASIAQREPQVEWYQKEDDEWDVVTWTDPYIHIPIQGKLPIAYSKGATSITLPVPTGMVWYEEGGGRIPIIPEGETRKQALSGTLTYDLPDNSYLFFANHYRRYTITDWSWAGSNYVLTFTPALEFNVLADSYVTISNHRIYGTVEKDTSIVTIDASNAILITLDEFSGEYGFHVEGGGPNYEYWVTKWKVDKYFYPDTWVKFQSHDKIYTIKSVEPNLVDSNYQIELNETLEQALEPNEAIFLYTPIKAVHWEEVRTALDNLDPLPRENRFVFYHITAGAHGDRSLPPIMAEGDGGTVAYSSVAWSSLVLEDEFVTYQDPVLVCPQCGTPAISEYSRYSATWTTTITYTLDTLKGIPQYIYDSPVWQQQIIGGKVIRDAGSTATIRKFKSHHMCPDPCGYEWDENPHWTNHGYNLQHPQVTADGISTCQNLMDGTSGTLWLNNIKRSIFETIGRGYWWYQIPFENSLLVYSKLQSTDVDMSFGDGEYGTWA